MRFRVAERENATGGNLNVPEEPLTLSCLNCLIGTPAKEYRTRTRRNNNITTPVAVVDRCAGSVIPDRFVFRHQGRQTKRIDRNGNLFFFLSCIGISFSIFRGYTSYYVVLRVLYWRCQLFKLIRNIVVVRYIGLTTMCVIYFFFRPWTTFQREISFQSKKKKRQDVISPILLLEVSWIMGLNREYPRDNCSMSESG